MLEELGIPYEHIVARPHSTTVRTYNPLGKVPALVEFLDDVSSVSQKPFVMYESAAINTYLGDLANSVLGAQQGTTDLVPKAGTHLRGMYEQTVSCIMTELDSQGLWIHRKHESMGQFFGFIPEAVEHAKGHFEKVNAVLAQQIKDNKDGPYLVGSSFTAADILYVHCLNWSKIIGWGKKWSNNDSLCRYYRLCTERPSYQKVNAMRQRENHKQDLKTTRNKL
jgi:glutathione S-transferase